MSGPDFKDEDFDFKPFNAGPMATRFRRKGSSSSVYVNLAGSDFLGSGVVKASVYGRNSSGKVANCTNRGEYFYLEAGKKYELYNSVRENGYGEAQIVFSGMPGMKVRGKWSPDYTPDPECLTVGDAKGAGKGNTSNQNFDCTVGQNGECWTPIRTKGNSTSVYLNLERSRGGTIGVQVYGLCGKSERENCTNNAEQLYNLELGKKYELYNTVREKGHFAAQIKFIGRPGTKVVGCWSPDYTTEKGCITVGKSGGDGVPIRPITNKQVWIDVPAISQLGRFPTGCESVSATMLLQFHKYGLSVNDFIDKYLVRKSVAEHPDPNCAFVGNPYDDHSYGCFAPCIATAMNKILKGAHAEVVRDKSIDQLCDMYIKKGNPVLIWATMHMLKTRPTSTWVIGYVDENARYKKGSSFTWPGNEHCLVLTGFSDKDYFVNDPLQTTDKVKGAYDKKVLQDRYREQGSQAVVVVKDPTPSPAPAAAASSSAAASTGSSKPDNFAEILGKVCDFGKGLLDQTVKNETEPLFMVIGTFANSSEIQRIPDKFKSINVGDRKIYLLGKVTADVVTCIQGAAEAALGMTAISSGIGGSAAGAVASATGVGAAVGAPVMVVSAGLVAAGAAAVAHGGGVMFSSMRNLQGDLKDFDRKLKDSDTILGNGTFQRTNLIEKGAVVYKKDKKYYHRDTLHRGEAAHLEVYDKRGKHLGEADIHTGEIKPGTADPKKFLKV